MYTDEALFAACGVRIAFTERSGGVSEAPYASLNMAGHVGDDRECVLRNRALAMEALGMPDVPVVVPNQVHGSEVLRVDEPARVDADIKRAKAGIDAVEVDVPGVAALMNFADCLPLIIVAPSGRFSVVHVGWRGAVSGIAQKAARMLAEGADGEDPAGFNAYIGPYIHVDCFETSAEIAAQFAERFGDAVLADARHVDLARVASVDLMRAGVVAGRIADLDMCTVCNTDRFYSYRAEGVTGRHSAIAVRMKR